MNKINVFLSEMLCVVVLVAKNGEFQRFEGFCIGRLSERITSDPKPFKSLKIRRFQLQERQHTPFQEKIRSL